MMKVFIYYNHENEIVVPDKKFKNWDAAIEFADQHNELVSDSENYSSTKLISKILGEKQTFQL